MPGSNESKVRSRQWQQACEPERGSSETARLTATSTRVGDDLPPWLELTGGGPFSSRRWRGSTDEWEERWSK
jgi:hypothetical protein